LNVHVTPQRDFSAGARRPPLRQDQLRQQQALHISFRIPGGIRITRKPGEGAVTFTNELDAPTFQSYNHKKG
jgi:hypothetical protein